MGFSRSDMVRIAQRTGCPYVEAWSGIENGPQGTVVGVVLHHTGTPDSIAGDIPTLEVLRNGHATLSGPLAQWGLSRSGVIYLITEQLANHAGVGEYAGITNGNAHFHGIEAESGGAGVWSANQIDAYDRLTASILFEASRPWDWAIPHYTWALPAGRKSDRRFFPEADSDARVQAYLANPQSITRGVKAPNEGDEEDMAIVYQNPSGLYVADGAGYRPIGEQATADNLVRAGAKVIGISLAEHQRWIRALDAEQLPLIVTIEGRGVDADWPGVWALDSSGYHHLGSQATVDTFRARGSDDIAISRAEHDEWVSQVGASA